MTQWTVTRWRSGEDAERQSFDHHERLKQQDGPPPVHSVGQDPAVEGEEENRQRAESRDQPDGEGGVGELEDEPTLRHRLNPGAAEGDELAGEKEPKVAMAGGGEKRRSEGTGGR